MSDRIVRIGAHSAFWGDSNEHASQIVREGGVDYLVGDYLSEITMSLLARARAADPSAGYAADFVTSIAPLLGEIRSRGIRLVTNAGGINPRGARDALAAKATAQGVAVRIAIVEGDDLMPQLDEIRRLAPHEMFSDAGFPPSPLSINAYLGAVPIARALDAGADIVVCGRCVDSALTLGILMHEFEWSEQDYDLLAAGSLAGHVIECGTQATGGIFTDWEQASAGWDNMGLPIVECATDGAFTVTKPEGTGGLVSPGTVAEQILYEIGDPAAYILPDVVCDFSEVRAERDAGDRIRVVGARGRAPTPTYKISTTYPDGFRIIATAAIAGWQAAAKARRTGEAILQRVGRLLAQRGFAPFSETSVEAIGAEEAYGENARTRESREVVLRIGARHSERRALDVLASEIAPAGVSMAQGTTGLAGGRPTPSPVIRLFSFLYDKERVPVSVDIDGRAFDVAAPHGGQNPGRRVAAGASRAPVLTAGAREADRTASSEHSIAVPLRALAFGRSGDKGDTSNIGIIARRPEYFALIGEQLTPERVAAFFAHYLRGAVTRYELPGLLAYNFVLENALGGGGTASLRYDPQGKAFAQVLLDETIDVPLAWAAPGRELAGFESVVH
jgi:acyclic terpene utilization AtuA family protein